MSGGGRRTWYEMASGLTGADQGKFARLCIVKCSKCDNCTSEKQSGLTDDALRRKFISKGWAISKRGNQHLCPDHARKFQQKPHCTVITEEPRPASVNRLIQTWTECSNTEREGFQLWLYEQGKKIVDIQHGFQHGPHIDSMPIEAPPPTRAHPPPVSVVEQTFDPEDEEIANIIFGKSR